MLWRNVVDLFTRSGGWMGSDDRAPVEVVVLRAIGASFLGLMIIATATTAPSPSPHGHGLLVSVGLVAVAFGVFGASPRKELSQERRIAALVTIALGGSLLMYAQPHGIWEAAPYYIAIVAAMRLERRVGAITVLVCIVPFVVVAAATGNAGGVGGALVGAVPWYFVMRLMSSMREKHNELLASREAEARTAAIAARGRLAREMHDVLAHSLSALALQLESTRLLAHDRGVDADVSRAIDQAHHLAAGGLEEARQAISAVRGTDLPGPERLQALARAFEEQSGLPVSVEVRGTPRELAPDARLAVYRTAQEALTNVRRHSLADRVAVRLEYEDEATVLSIEDHGVRGVPVAVGAVAGPGGYGLTGMRERAELLGGHLLAEPCDDGFRVRLWLPAA